MPKKRRAAAVVELPKGVHRVVSRGKEYYYWQPGRGTKGAPKAKPLPRDPTTPEFWIALREAQGIGVAQEETFTHVCDLYEASTRFAKLTEGTKDQYRRGLRTARKAWGELPAQGLRSSHVLAMMDKLATKPGKANTFLGVMRALSAWGMPRNKFAASLTEGVEPFPKEGGHKPWTAEQIKAAHDGLTGMVRRGVLLALYTGQRGSDVVRLGATHVDDGGFNLTQRKTQRQVWCPIVPELAREMATWERRPGPFVLHETGKPYSRKVFWKHFKEQADKIPALAGVTLHGLRSTAVIRLRREGLSTAQIQDIIGMSLAMIERYSRFADRKASGQAAIVSMAERRKNANV